MPRYRLVIDLATDRVVWFTDDMIAPLTPDACSAVAEYEGLLPDTMTVKNSWNYRFRNKEITSTSAKSTAESLIEQGRKTMVEFINTRFNERYKTFMPQTPTEAIIELETFAAAKELQRNSDQVISQYDRMQHNWVNLYRTKIKEPEMFLPALIQHIIDSYNKQCNLLCQLEWKRLDFLDEVAKATTDRELFDIRDRVFAAVNATKD